ncbi:hypothetical protein JOB18_048363 [Solea senegalensis]|uniref:Uncharacterized protein n=1 Tax=Solea senegalensis TaxID=28829 RepID=A0AAV6Q8A3_SOLSE|nr:hypothetical protein JOB18_048363 [Solea senegalensis]
MRSSGIRQVGIPLMQARILHCGKLMTVITGMGTTSFTAAHVSLAALMDSLVNILIPIRTWPSTNTAVEDPRGDIMRVYRPHYETRYHRSLTLNENTLLSKPPSNAKSITFRFLSLTIVAIFGVTISLCKLGADVK